MKTKIYYLIAFVIVALAACTAQKGTSVHDQLDGRWHLTETLNDIGDGKGKYVAVTADSSYITFSKAGLVGGNAIYGATNYKLIDATHLALTIKGNTAPINYRYKVDGNDLELNAPCREACGLRFKRMK
ncbi:hypothetical protein [Mucilaginibacter terrae]|uniref:Lipocalin-like domain-containing protein n=1 Tax=Mucilaginibacter terrae TaxID=1955052 RepID=A0ABU3GSF1_9SPHI|nr:hypothetical protein [Mucilaginibacter terrae]MDT3402705.1 hypothetical protein [Mucilaginibacter terrae]